MRAKPYYVHENQCTQILNLSSPVCRSLRGKLGEQKMSELPFNRFQEEPPFTYRGVDLFGPFVICSKRKELKRYGVFFTCLCSRPIHIEVANSLDRDSFLLQLRRFTGRRAHSTDKVWQRKWLCWQLKNCGNPSKTWVTVEFNESLQIHGADWITWINNPLAASHMVGVW